MSGAERSGKVASALDQILEIAVAEPCREIAPRLHLLIDGELAAGRADATRKHLAACGRCRNRLELLELEEQTIREITAPTPRRFAELWSDRLTRKLAELRAER